MLGPDVLDVVMVSFEGPDQYSLAGGLGVRARELCRAMASLGYPTTLAFVGDPNRPAEETVDSVHLLRWCQELSRHHPAGVYDGERAKVERLCATLPAHLIDTVIRPAAARGRIVAVLCEEWHTADFAITLHEMLSAQGLRDRCALLWNANNHFGFDEIDWSRLSAAATVTTVSRYMKHLMWPHGLNPMVIPNGISSDVLRPVDESAVQTIREAAATSCLTFKIGRFSPDKRWHQALSAIAELRREEFDARLLMRGGIEPFGSEVMQQARSCGLVVADWHEPISDAADIARALAQTDSAPVVNLCRFLPDAVIPEISRASTAVLANSGHEPFGLVGLEAMAAGGVAVVGATGEEYARPYGNAVVIETDDGAELASALRGLVERPELAARLREAARRDAEDFAWTTVIEGLVERLRFVCWQQRTQLPLATA